MYSASITLWRGRNVIPQSINPLAQDGEIVLIDSPDETVTVNTFSVETYFFRVEKLGNLKDVQLFLLIPRIMNCQIRHDTFTDIGRKEWIGAVLEKLFNCLNLVTPSSPHEHCFRIVPLTRTIDRWQSSACLGFV